MVHFEREIFENVPITLTDNHYFNVNISHKLSTTNSVNVDGDYVRYNLVSPGTFKNIGDDKSLQEISVQRRAPLDIFTARVDYLTHRDRSKFEWGMKVSSSRMKNKAMVDDKIDGEWLINDTFTSTDHIAEDVYAAYGSFNKNLDQRNLIELGLRYEYYDYNINSNQKERNYSISTGNLYPVIRWSFEVDSLRTLNIAFNRRVTRPQFGQLASLYAFTSSRSVVTAGSPTLRPTLATVYKVSYQHRSIMLGIELSRARQFINWHNSIIKETHQFTSNPVNFDLFRIASLNASFPIHFSKDWDGHFTLTGQHRLLQDTRSDQSIFEHSKMNVIAQMSHELRLTKKLAVDISGNYISSHVFSDQIMRGFGGLNVGLQTKLAEIHSISLAFNNILLTDNRFKWSYHSQDDDFINMGLFSVGERTMMVTYSVKFGNEHLKKQRERKTASEEERNRAN